MAATKENLYRLHSVSVVVTAKFHNPSVLNRDFLVSKRIVPEDWEVTEGFTTPGLSVLSYNNGIQWTLDQSKLTVTESCDSSFRDEYRVYSLVAAYLEVLPDVPYRSLGLNYSISKKQENPERWLTQRFLKSGNWLRGQPNILRMVPNFTLDADEAVCNISFSAGQVPSPQSEPHNAVIVNGNMHHAGPLDANGLRAAIGRWPSRQAFVITALHKLLRKPQR